MTHAWQRRERDSCSRCHVVKPVEEFYQADTRRGYTHACKACERERMKTTAARRYAERKARGVVRKPTTERSKHYELRKHYGIGLSDYNRMSLEQNGVCASCGDAPTSQGLVVDHCHESDEIRALLCTRCNAGIGFFLDDPIRLDKAAGYLRTFLLRRVLRGVS